MSSEKDITSSGHDFDKLSQYYDPAVRFLLSFFGGENRFRKKAADFLLNTTALPLSNVKAADFGCGTGTFIKYLPHGWRIKCVDKSQKMLEVASSKLNRDGVEFICGDVFDALFFPEEFDLTIAMFFLHEFPPQGAWKAFDRIVSWTKTGGYIYIVDFIGSLSRKWKLISLLLSFFENAESRKTMLTVMPFLRHDVRLELIAERKFAAGAVTAQIFKKVRDIPKKF